MGETNADGFVPVADGLYLEGLAYDRQRDIVWYSDVVAGGVHGVTPAGAAVLSFNADRKWTGGILLNADGAVLSSGMGGIMWNHPETGASGWLIREIDGQPINGVNEMIPDGAGGLYFGTVDLENIATGATPRAVAIYHLADTGALTLAASGLGFTNGLMLSADGKWLFCNESFKETCVFEVQPDHTLTNRRTVLSKPDCDGMALDADGTLWITGFTSSAIARIDGTGQRLADWPTPGGAVTQIRFGGADGRDVYVATVPVDGGKNLKAGALPHARGSVLYRARCEMVGQAVDATCFPVREYPKVSRAKR